MTNIFPRPGDRIIDLSKPDSVIFRAGDRTKRAEALAARRAAAEVRANDPEVQAKEIARAAQDQRDRLEGAFNTARSKLDNLLIEESRLIALRNQVDTKTLRTGFADRMVGEITAKLAQLARVKVQAQTDIDNAFALLQAHDAYVAERKEAVAAELRAAQHDTDRRARAEAAAKAAYDAVMAEPAQAQTEPTPTVTSKRKASRS